MPFEMPITVRQAVENVTEDRYVLPAIQREFVWEAEQIEILFDSMLRGYPIGSFLFWQVPPNQVQLWQFYKFLTDYHELNARHNKPAHIANGSRITAVLDGQQRLTALTLALAGSYAQKLPNKHRSNLSAYPLKKLYIDLLAPESDDNNVKHYALKFLTAEEVEQDTEHYWASLPDIYKKIRNVHDVLMCMAEPRISSAPPENREFAAKVLARICECINSEGVVNFFLEREADLDRVLQIFIRINSGGTKLSYSDLLLSIATASWKKLDAREEIHKLVDELNSYSEELTVDKDFVLKSCLVLSDIGDIKFKVTNFNAENMELIESKWSVIRKALAITIQLISSFGLRDRSLLSLNAIIPIAYYLMRRGSDEDFIKSNKVSNDRLAIRKWLVTVLLRGTFGSMADTILAALRSVIGESDMTRFPVEAINERLASLNRAVNFADDEIEALFDLQYTDRQTFLVLSLLYPNFDYDNGFHIDHIYPRSKLTKRKLERLGFTSDIADEAAEHRDDLSNLQLLQGKSNQSKSNSDFDEWLATKFPLEKDRGYFLAMHHFPQMAEFSYGHFRKFLKEREKKLLEELKVQLG